MNILREHRDILRSVRGVDGWLDPVDGWLFCLLSEMQTKTGVSGNIIEIGTYLGKSAIILGQLLSESETLYANDLFGTSSIHSEDQSGDDILYDRLTEEKFLENYLAQISKPPIVICEDSKLLHQRHFSEGFRIIHVDGDHQNPSVRSDLEFAVNNAVVGGIVVVDDYRNISYPAVGIAVWNLVSNDRLCPLVLSESKIFSCRVNDYHLLQPLVEDMYNNYRVGRLTEIDGKRVWSITQRDLLIISEISFALLHQLFLRWGRLLFRR